MLESRLTVQLGWHDMYSNCHILIADNAAVFRDLKATGYRKVLQEKQGFREVEVSLFAQCARAD